MVIKEVINKRRRDFNTTMCLTGIIPFLVFIYLLVVKISSFTIFIGEIGYIMFATLVVFVMGVVIGRRLLWSMLKEIIEKNRLAAVTETALALSHEINNPLLTINGNLELLEGELKQINISDKSKDRLSTIRNSCERIRLVTDKMSKLSKPAITTIHGKIKMINLEASS